MNAAGAVDAMGALERRLRAAVAGDVRFDGGSRTLYATDASNYRQVPVGVVVPRSTDDVLATLAVCRELGVPVLPRGTGTSLAGQACNVAVVLDFTRHLDRILTLDPVARLATVEPGIVLDRLRRAAAPYGLGFGPDPSTHDRCTLGGMIGNDACGVRSLRWGRTLHQVERLEVVTYDGLRLELAAGEDAARAAAARAGGRAPALVERLAALAATHADGIRSRLPAIPRRVSGYAVDQLLPENGFHLARALVGSEGTCAVILAATVRLVPLPPARALAVLGFSDVFAAADAVPAVLAHDPDGLEGVDGALATALSAQPTGARLAVLPPGDAWLLVELAGEDGADATARAQRLVAATGGNGLVVTEPSGQLAFWRLRESAVGAAARLDGTRAWPGWEDSAVAPEHLGTYLRGLRALLRRYGYAHTFYGHFGEGCVHARIGFELATAAGIARFRAFLDEAADLVVAHGGSLSGEHGDGQARGALLERMVGSEVLGVFRRFAAIWDPDRGLNPGKLVDARPPDGDLRLAGDRRGPAPERTHFHFAADGGSLRVALERCVGVGACRRLDHGTMCPSFMATRDERHSTRGRARLLEEMLRGDVLRGGWRDPAVREALDLCLACKACKRECPAGVDMAAYKAEFLAHHWAGLRRPPHAWLFGLLPWTLRLARRMPRLVNAIVASSAGEALVRRVGRIAPERRLPRIAEGPRFPGPGDPGTARAVVAGAAPGRPLVLWADTFTRALAPEVGHAARRALADLGFAVAVPDLPCCGRPLYDQGLLGLARRQLRRVVDALRPFLADGTPIVVLEPSCASVLRDEILELLPEDPDARRVAAATVLLPELLARETGLALPRRTGRALLHPHCHATSLGAADAGRVALERLGYTVEVPDAGCCGMAGAFGFGAGDAYAVSVGCAERVLMPVVRALPAEAVVVADGWSCREQVRQLDGRRALHTAELLAGTAR